MQLGESRYAKALEAYRIGKDRVSRDTAHGPASKAPRPIFRDREDISAGHSLIEQTLATLPPALRFRIRSNGALTTELAVSARQTQSKLPLWQRQ
jgi:hypothetical protein